MKLLQVVCLLLLSSFVVAQQLQCPPGYQLVRKLDLFPQPTSPDIASVKAPPAAELTTSHGDISTGEKTAAHEAKTIVREVSKGTSTTVREESLSPPDSGALIEGRLGIKKLIAEKQGNAINQNPTLQPKVEAITNQEVKGLPADWKVQQNQKISLSTSYNNKDGAEDNITIYTYLKEVERIVNGKRSVENLNYRIYDIGNGKNMREVAGVNITTPSIEDVAKTYGCVRTTDIVNPSVHVEKNVITLSQTEDKPAPNSAAAESKPPLVLHIDTTIIDIPAVQKAPQVPVSIPETPKTDAPKVDIPKAEAVVTTSAEVPKVEIKSDSPKAEAHKADPPKDQVAIITQTEVKTEVKTESLKVEPTKTDSPKVDSAPIPKPEEHKVDIPNVDSPKTEVAKHELPVAEAPKTDVPKLQAPKIEVASTPKSEPKVETPKSDPAEVPKVELPKVDVSAITIHVLKNDEPKADIKLETSNTKAETPKVETPKIDIPKVEAPKSETPKAEAPKVDKIDTPKSDVTKVESPKPTETPKQETKVQAPKTDAPKPADPPATTSQPEKGDSSKAQPTTVTKVSNKPLLPKPTPLPVNPYLIDPHYQPPVIARRSPEISTLIEPTYYPTIPSSIYTPSDYIYTPTKYKPRSTVGIQYVTISGYPYNLGRIEYPRSQSVRRTYTQTTTDSSSSAAKTTDVPAATPAAAPSAPAPTAAPASTPAPAK